MAHSLWENNRAVALLVRKPEAFGSDYCLTHLPGCMYKQLRYANCQLFRYQALSRPSDLIQGTLDLLILKTISSGPKHGWAIAKRIEQVSDDALQVTQGALYPALHRLEQQGWISAKWRKTETGARGQVLSIDQSRSSTTGKRTGAMGAPVHAPSGW